MPHRKIEQAIADIRAGRLVIVADDEHRENEGDLVGAAEKVTPEMINFMATHGRGLICLTLMPERCQALGLAQMAEHNTEAHETAFTVSVDAAARFGVTTGISAADRAATIRVAIDPATVPTDLRRPGHVFPLRARPGGVLQRVGQTEASVDLARLAGLYPAGVICEILNPDGTIDRKRLAAPVFRKPERLARLNELVHPHVIRREQELMDQFARLDPNGITVVEAAILIETGSYKRFDRLILVECDEELQIERALKRDNVDRAEVLARLERQMPVREKRKFADYVIDTSGSKEETLTRVREVYDSLRRISQ